MFLDIIAPWIIEAWSEALSAAAFDVPVLGLNPYQGHVAMAVAAGVLLSIFWGTVAHLPSGVRTLSRCLMALVLLAPLGVFAARHVEAMVAFARDPAAAELPAQREHSVTASVPHPMSPLTQPLPQASPLPEAPPPVAVAALPAEAPSPLSSVASEPRAVVATEADAVSQKPETQGTPALSAKQVVASLTKLLPGTADNDLVPVFFGTDRAVESNSARLDYSAERARQLTLGQAFIQVPKRHQTIGRERTWAVSSSQQAALGTPGPSDVGQFAVHDIKPLPLDQFVQAATTRLSASRQYKDHALVLVHGFNTTFDAALYRAAQMAYDLHFDGVPFVYSWPSAGRVARYSYDSDSVREAEPHLAEFLRIVISRSGAKSISIIAHGLGSGPVLQALAAAKGNIPAGVELREIILSAPDMDRPTFEARIQELSGLARHITLYTAATDRGLNISRRFTGGVPRAGDVLEGGPMVLPGVETVDASIPGTDAIGRNHAGYVEAAPLVADIAARLRSEPGAGSGLESIATAKGPYWRFSAQKASR